MSKHNFKVGDKVEFVFYGDLRVGTIVEIDDTGRWNQCILVYSKGMHGHSASTSPKGKRKTMEYWWVEPEKLRLKNNETIVIYRKGQEVIALDKTTGKKAVAKCSPEDEFDFNIGSKLAFERLLGIEQPQYKEVKRRAKKGECVKIVKPETTSGAYGKDDILKVIETDYCGVYCVGAKITLESGYYVRDTEYVVLEGYKPPKEEKNVAFRFLCIEDDEGWLTKGKVYEAIYGRITYDHGDKGKYYGTFASWCESNKFMAECVVELKEGEDPDEIMKQYTFFNGKAVCTVTNREGYTYGKIYEFKEGYCIDDDGLERPCVGEKGYKELPSGFIAVVE